MAQHIITRSLNDGIETTTKTVTLTAEGQVRLDPVIAAAAANAPVDVAFPYARIKSVKLENVSSAQMTVKTNDADTPAQTFTIAANDMIEWKDGDPFTNPFTADVTRFYVTSVPGGTLRIRVLYDPTP